MSEENVKDNQVKVESLKVNLSSSKSHHADILMLHDKLNRVGAEILKLTTEQQTTLTKVEKVNSENRDLWKKNESLENEIKGLASKRRKLENSLKREKRQISSKPEAEIRELKSKLREKRSQLENSDKSLIKQNNRNNALCSERDRLKQDLHREIESLSKASALNNELKLQMESLQKQLADSEASQKTLNSTSALRKLLTEAEKKEQRTDAAVKMLRLQVDSITKENNDLKNQLNAKLEQIETLTSIVDMKGASESVRYERFLENNRELECEIANLKRQLKENANVVFTQKEDIILLESMVGTHDNNLAEREAKIKQLGEKASESDAHVKKLEREAKEKDQKLNELLAKLQAAYDEIKTLNLKSIVLEERLKKPHDLCAIANEKHLENEVKEKNQKLRMLEKELEETVMQSLESQKEILQLKLNVDSLKNSLNRKNTKVMEFKEEALRKDEMMKNLEDKAAEKDEKVKKWKQAATLRAAKLKRMKKSALRKVEAERDKASKIVEKLGDEARKKDELVEKLKKSIKHHVVPLVAPEESESLEQKEKEIASANETIQKLVKEAEEKDKELEELKQSLKKQSDRVDQLLKKLDSLELDVSGVTWDLDQERKQREQDQAQIQSQVESLRKKEDELTHATQNVKTLGEVVERFKADNIQNVCFVDGILKEKADLETRLRAIQDPTSLKLKCELNQSLTTCEQKLQAATATIENLKCHISGLERSVEEKNEVIRGKEEQLSEKEMRLTYLSMELTALTSEDERPKETVSEQSQIRKRCSGDDYFNEETQRKRAKK